MADITILICFMPFILGLLGVATFLIIRSALKLKLANLMKKTETSQIVDIRPGFVEVKGRGEPIMGRVLRTPVNGYDALMYDTKVQRLESHGKSSSWRTIWKRNDGVPFFVNDGTAKMKVDPRNAKTELTMKTSQRTGTFSNASPQFSSFLQSQGISEKGFFGVLNQSLRYEESFISPGREVYILGTAIDAGLEPSLEMDPMVMPFTISKLYGKKPYLITDRSEESMYGRLMTINILVIIGSGVLVLISLLIGFAFLMSFLAS
ncbi:MAG: GIDE domain-containing protein [Thermoplasmatota archaeon]